MKMPPPATPALLAPEVKCPMRIDDRHEALIGRVCAEYWEMPGLCLTVQQACRLWQINLTDCTRILEWLVAQHVLKRSATGVFIADDLRCPEGSIRREAQT